MMISAFIIFVVSVSAYKNELVLLGDENIGSVIKSKIPSFPKVNFK